MAWLKAALVALLLQSALALRLSPLRATRGAWAKAKREWRPRGKQQVQPKLAPLTGVERRAATRRMQEGRFAARKGKDAAYFWRVVREQSSKTAAAAKPRTVSLALDLPIAVSPAGSATDPNAASSSLADRGPGEPDIDALRDALGLSFDGSLCVTGARGQAAAALAATEDEAEDGDEDAVEGASAGKGEKELPPLQLSRWRLKGVNGLAVGSVDEYATALRRCWGRNESRVFVQLVDMAAGSGRGAWSYQELFGGHVAARMVVESYSVGSGASYAAAAAAVRNDLIPVTRVGYGAHEAEVPPLRDFADLVGDGFAVWSVAACTCEGAAGAAAGPVDRGASGAGRKPVIPAFVGANLVRGDRMGLRIPTPIQRHCIPLAMAELDLMACAETGSGKVRGGGLQHTQHTPQHATHASFAHV